LSHQAQHLATEPERPDETEQAHKQQNAADDGHDVADPRWAAEPALASIKTNGNCAGADDEEQDVRNLRSRG
jgi:hypothetical protein